MLWKNEIFNVISDKNKKQRGNEWQLIVRFDLLYHYVPVFMMCYCGGPEF